MSKENIRDDGRARRGFLPMPATRCHPKPLRIYRHAGFAVYARCTVSF